MDVSVRLTILALVSAGLSVAGTWSGLLVDTKCYESEERNVNPTDTLTSVDRDISAELRFCSPQAKTISFTLVQADNQSFRLDAAGNAKAAELVRKTGKTARLAVAVTGEAVKHMIHVESISIEK
jgi:hypothetical protein